MSRPSNPTAVFDAVLQYNRGRTPEGVRRKLRRMDEDTFAFFRGTDHLFAAAWADLAPPDVGPAVLICGDLHWENFGAYRTDAGDFRYDINDFDEALVAPCSLDLVRCTTSILLAAEQWRLTPLQAAIMALAYLDAYRKAVTETVASGTVPEVGPRTGRGPIWDLLGATMLGTQAALLDRYTERKHSGARRILRGDDKHPEVDEARAAEVRAAVEAHGRAAGKAEEYAVLDVTGRVAGIGSLGLRRYTVLIAGGGTPDENRLLDVKECRTPSLLACAGADRPQPPGPEGEARRVVDAQHQLQARPAAGLDVLRVGDQWYRMRETVPDENRSSLDHLRKKADEHQAAVEVVGQITGWSQLRGAGPGAERWAELARWASGPALDSLLAAAVRYADRSCRDYADYHRAYAEHRTGELRP